MKANDLFLVPGMFNRGGEYGCWQNYIPFFYDKGKYEQVISPTLPNRDKTITEEPDPALGTTRVRDDVNFLVKQFEDLPEKPDVIAWSYGAILCMHLAPANLFNKIILLCPGPTKHNKYPLWYKLYLIQFGYKSIVLTRGYKKKPVHRTYKESAFTVMNKIPIKEREELYNNSSWDSGAMIHQVGFPNQDPDNSIEINGNMFSCPTQVVGAEHDRLVPRWMLNKHAHKFHHNTIQAPMIFRNHAHNIMLEPGWEYPAEQMRRYLSIN